MEGVKRRTVGHLEHVKSRTVKHLQVANCKKNKLRTKPKSGSKGLCKALRRMFSTFGRPKDLSSDGGPEFSAARTSEFLKRWGVTHTLSSAYFPQSNGRAEMAVRITKRLLEDHVGPDGSIYSDSLVVAPLQLRNTPAR